MHFKWLFVIALFHACVNAEPTGSIDLSPRPDIGQQSALEQPFQISQPSYSFNERLHAASSSVASNTTDIITTAMSMIGIRYRFGGTNAETGFDCSGLVRAIYQDAVGHHLPRKASEQAKATQKIDKKDLQPGDLVFFNTMRRAFSHVGIYMGNGKFIHAPRKGQAVRVESMQTSYWHKRFNGARRVNFATAPALEVDQLLLHIERQVSAP